MRRVSGAFDPVGNTLSSIGRMTSNAAYSRHSSSVKFSHFSDFAKNSAGSMGLAASLIAADCESTFPNLDSMSLCHLGQS